MPAPRDASTVILARPRPDGGYEVLMTLRPASMAFMGGTYVFPGGTLDDGDASDAMAARSALSADEAAARLGEDLAPGRALGLHCCALRELFEEVGILIARTADGRPVDPATVRTRYAPRQADLASDPQTFARFLSEEGLVLATDLLVRHGRLITPEMSPIRFDARFFVAPYPEGQELVPDPREVPDARWMQPSEAIRQAAEGAIAIPIPTMAILQGLAEVPGYEQLLRGETATREVHAAELSPLVSHVLAPNPGLATGPGTNSYVVGRGEVAIVDPAVPDPVYIEVLTRRAGDRGRPTLILLTHLHPDHIGGAEVLRSELRCDVAAWEGVGDEAPFVTRRLRDGEDLHVGGATLRALHTPGHASHHLCFHLPQEDALFAGDVVAGLGTVVISPPDGDMAAYLDTLERLRGLGLRRIYPGHGPTVEDPESKLTEYIEHRRDRERQVLEALPGTIPEMVKRIYADVPESLHAMAEMSVLAHLEMLSSAGRVRRDGDRWAREERPAD